jgi:stage IV sporulation protein FB
MGWQDRDYNRIGGRRFENPLLNFLFGSLPLGTYFRIRMRLHSSFLVFVLFELLLAKARYGYGYTYTAISLLVLFTIVVLHEFGHCIGARLVGGDADEILIWPLGGLASAQPPHRPWATFVTVAAGPGVNVLICAVTGAALFALGHWDFAWANPLISFGGGARFVDGETYALLGPTHLVGWLFSFFTVSASQLFFNLLPIFPLDGGQMLQAILWKPLGYRRAMGFATITGMIGAVFGFFVGMYTSSGMLMFLAIAGFMTCFQMRRMLRMTADEESSEQYDLSAAWEIPVAPKTRRKSKKRWVNAARRRALADQAEQARIDAILAKVKERGLHSLSWWEKRTLKKATERQRQQDLAGRL